MRLRRKGVPEMPFMPSDNSGSSSDIQSGRIDSHQVPDNGAVAEIINKKYLALVWKRGRKGWTKKGLEDLKLQKNTRALGTAVLTERFCAAPKCRAIAGPLRARTWKAKIQTASSYLSNRKMPLLF